MTRNSGEPLGYSRYCCWHIHLRYWRNWNWDGSIRNVENGDVDPTILHRLAIIGALLSVRRNDGRGILVGNGGIGGPVLRRPVTARLGLVGVGHGTGLGIGSER